MMQNCGVRAASRLCAAKVSDSRASARLRCPHSHGAEPVMLQKCFVGASVMLWHSGTAAVVLDVEMLTQEQWQTLVDVLDGDDRQRKLEGRRMR